MADRARQNQQSYDRIASDYLARTGDRSVMRDWLRRFAGYVPDGTVLDLGAGPCADSAELRRLGLRVVSLDRSRQMLLVGRERFPGARVQADMWELPFRRDSFAAVWANASLLHLGRTELQPTLRGVARILRPGGVLYISLKAGEGEGWDSSRYGNDAPRWFTYWTEPQVDDVLAAAGLEVLEALTDRIVKETWIVRIARRPVLPRAPVTAVDAVLQQR